MLSVVAYSLAAKVKIKTKNFNTRKAKIGSEYSANAHD